MSWWSSFEAVFFDLDGLLVNTEELHWNAYREMCYRNGVNLEWDFSTYYSIASRSATGVLQRLIVEHPKLFEQKDWEDLYQEKRAILLKKFQSEVIPLMPGVETLLSSLQGISIPCAVVTHSSYSLVDQLQSQHHCFSAIQKWFARESYLNPKPAPDGYQAACLFFGVVPERCVGFEDSLRGVESLISAGVKPILVQKYDIPARNFCIQKGITTLSEIQEIDQS